jgi:hypothetical protein
MCVSHIKENIPSVLVKNKQHVRESKHAFNLGSMVYIVAYSQMYAVIVYKKRLEWRLYDKIL